MGWMENWGIDPAQVKVSEDRVRLCGGKDWHLAFRAISSATDRRTVIAAILPGDIALSTTAPTLDFPKKNNDPLEILGEYEDESLE